MLLLGLIAGGIAPLCASTDTIDPAVAITLKVIADPEGSLDAAAVLAGAHDPQALPAGQRAGNLGYPRHPWWAVIDVHNRSALAQARELVLWRGAVHTQQAYVLQADGEGVRPLDYALGISRHAVLSLQLPAQASQRIAIRLASTSALSLDYRLFSVQQLADVDRIDYWFFGMLAGVVVAIAIYVLALYFAVRDPLYLQFVGFAVCILIYQLHTEGYAYILWGEHLRWPGTLVAAYSGALFSILLVQFIRNFMQLDTYLPWAGRWMLGPSVALVCTVFPLFLIRPWLGNTMAALSVILVALVGGASVILAARKSRPEWSLVFGVLLFSTAGAVHLLRRIGALADSQALSLLLQLGSAVLMISFAIAVMSRVRRIVIENREAQASHARQLESEVAERTAELQHAKEAAEQALASLQATQQQLVQSEKMASLGQLVAGVAHEVNTPLGVALTASSFLEERAHTVNGHMQDGKLTRSELAGFLDETEHSAEMIERNLSRAAHLVSTFKQVSVDRTSDGRRSFRPHDYTRDLVESLELTWKRRPIELQVECPPDLEMDSFPGALGQVLTNLIQNALIHAFGAEQPGLMRIAVRALGGERVQLEFSDNGRGATAEELGKIFDPFYTTRRNQGGTGLGLHLTWNLVVQKLGGRIGVDGKPGAGLRFAIELPRRAPGEAVHA